MTIRKSKTDNLAETHSTAYFYPLYKHRPWIDYEAKKDFDDVKNGAKFDFRTYRTFSEMNLLMKYKETCI